ncbi:MAG: hypothetical protein ACERKD_18165 [Prolixibacteraceae bacterium]
MKARYYLMGLSVFFLIAQTTTAQEIDFDLKNYKTTDYERSSLDFYFNFNESTTKKQNEEETPDYVYSLASQNLRSRFNLDYSTINLSRDKLMESGATLSASLNNSFSENYRSMYFPKYTLEKSSNVGSGIEFFRNVSNFYSPQFNKFWEYKVDAKVNMTNFYIVQEKDTNRFESSQLQIPASISLYIGHGHGRIEFVEDAVEAIYILDELQKKGLTIKEIGNDDIKQLADKITVLKKKRFFDNRFYREEVMEEFVMFLMENKLIQNATVGLFNTVNDYHYMAGINQRLSGHKFAYGIAPSLIAMQNYNKLDDSERSNYSLGANAKISYENHKPVDVKWQKDFYTDITFGLQNSKSKYNSENSGNWSSYEVPYSFNSSTNYTIGFYPDTRTYFGSTVYCNLNFNKLLNFENKNYAPTYDAGFNFSGYYYLSEHLRLNGSFTINYNYDSDGHPSSSIENTGYQFAQSFNVSFDYYIF